MPLAGLGATVFLMHSELILSGFLLSREDWDLLDDDTRELFTAMLAEEGRAPRFDEREASAARHAN